MTDKIRVKVLNKHFVAIWWRGTPTIEPNFFELTKQWCILDAKGVSLNLPYLSYSANYALEDSFPDVFRWRDALTSQNPPSRVNFRSNPERFRQLVEPLDFSKPYDAEAAAAIHAEFSGVSKVAEVDAADMIHAELEV